jgi:8-oxo-dGTP pyrophosphatase MutT (NUDIX family)
MKAVEVPTMHQVADVDARLDREPWPWAIANRDAIHAHWQKLTMSNPALYNGRVLVARERQIVGDILRVRYIEGDYASFLMLRDLGFPDPGTGNCFAMAALRSVDGAYLLGVMAPHTANGGRIYFPAGTPEPADVLPDGRVDLLGNVLRELTEETGLLPSDVEVAQEWTVVVEGGRTALMREMAIAMSADLLAERVSSFLASEASPEFSDIRLVRSVSDIDEQAVPPFVQRYLRASFARGTC